MAETQGRAFKVIAYQLRFLPDYFKYNIIFMRRHIAEVLASSGKIKLLRQDSPLSERQKVLAFKTEYVAYEAWLMKQAHMPALFVNYNGLNTPVECIREFLDLHLDADKIINVIDTPLFRNRGECLK